MEPPIKLTCSKCGIIFDKSAKEHRHQLKVGNTKFYCSRSCIPKPFDSFNKRRLSNQDIDEFLLDNQFSIKRIGNYIRAFDKITWQCLVCNNYWDASAHNIKMGRGCPSCHYFKNEELVSDLLKELSIVYERQYTIRLPMWDYPKRVDFYIPSLNLIIEYNGRQHYSPVCFGSKTEEKAISDFVIQQSRDEELRKYCKNNNINLLEIDGRKYTGQRLFSFVKNYFKII
jgi:predicted  nucleic acid-binding Zn-ribbon protein